MIWERWQEFQAVFFNYFTAERMFDYLIVLFKIVLIVVATKFLLRFSKFFVEHIFVDPPIKGFSYNQRRLRTLKYLTLSAMRYSLYFLAGTMILQTFNFPIASLLAGAGILGLAVGFGAQNLVRDIISGFFILLENQFSVGDHVKVGEIEGIVEEIGLRTTTIKNFAGQMQIVPNGEISIVTNFVSTESIRVMFDVSVAYEEDVDRVIAVLERVCAQFAEDQGQLLVEAPKVLGVQHLGDSGVSIRILGRAVPLEQWGVERALKRVIKKTFDVEGIEIPYPKRVLYMQGLEEKTDQSLCDSFES